MSNSKELLKLNSLSLNHETEAADDVIEAIKNTILGNPDGVRYRHLDSIKKIIEIKPLQFFTLRKDNSLLYVMALAERITDFKEKKYYTYNVRYVTFNQSFAAQTLTTDSTPAGIQKLGNSFIKEGMRKHADSFEFELQHPEALKEKRLYYAYVEESNLRSMNFTGFFFEPIRQFVVITYSKIFPKADIRVKKTGLEDFTKVNEILNRYYINHSFYFVVKESLINDYYILKVNDVILAGVRVQQANWKLIQLPGKAGRFTLKVLPYIAILSRIIKQDRFSFLTFDTVYCPSGNEKYLSKLFESVCAIKKVYAAMIYVDSQEELYKQITGLKNLGILNRLFKQAKGSILARFVNFSDDEKSEIKSSPVYISGYDLS